MSEALKNIKNDLKSLKIYHGAVRRLAKDIEYYELEEVKLSETLRKLKLDANTCPSDVKQGEEILQETVKVLPIIKESLLTNLKKLCDVVTTKFHDVLYFAENKIEFLKNYNIDDIDSSGENGSAEPFPGFADLYREVHGVNETLKKVFLKVDVSLPNCGQASGSPVTIPKEECVDI